jgi:hypothetical protein
LISDKDGSNQRLTEPVHDPLDRFMVAESLHQAISIEAQHLEKTGGKPDKFSDGVVLLLETFLVDEMTKRGDAWSGRLRWLKDVIRLKPDSHETYFKILMNEYGHLVERIPDNHSLFRPG